MRHLRILAAVLLLTMCGLSAKAQFVKFSFGIEGGGYGTYINSEPQLYPPFGYGGYGGANFELRLGRVIGLYVEGIYSYQTGSHTLMDNNEIPVTLTRQYFHIPVALHLWMGRGAIFEVGFQQSILMNSQYDEDGLILNPDEGALKYYTSVVAGFKFNMGRVVYLNLRGTYGLSPSYVVRGEGFPTISASVGLGFRLYTYKKSAFK